MPETDLKSGSIEINAAFRRALDLMETTDKNIFITGRAGTGKSTLLDYFRTVTRKRVAVLAPTGVAALNVRGQTIHSFCGFKPDITLQTVKKLPKKAAERAELVRRLETIVIDEVSMVRADLLELHEFRGRARFGEGPGRKEIGRLIMAGEQLPLGRGHDRRKLVEVADEDHLDAAEAAAGVRPVEAEELLEAVEEVGPDHGHLVDHDRFEPPDELGPLRGFFGELLDRLQGDVRLEPAE
jgi:hypothetical protein